MNNRKRADITFYVAGPIESCTPKRKKEIIEVRERIWEELKKPFVLIYDPIKMEAKKVGKNSNEQCQYLKGLKQGGHWNKFYEELWKIWFGSIDDTDNVMSVLQNLRMRKFIDGNYEEEAACWGDFESVVRSDFIIVHLPKVSTVGTHWEMLIAALFRIPIYLILPETSKTQSNSTMLFGVEKLSKGEVFYSVGNCIKFIKENYKI